MMALQPALQAVPIGERFSCGRCGGQIARRALPWVATWAVPVDPRVGEEIADMNAEAMLSDQIDFGSTTSDCDDLHSAMTVGAMEAMRLLGLEDGDTCPSEHPSTLAGPGAFFHRDSGFACTLFGVLATTHAGELILPNAGLRLPFGPGQAILFDPIQPHGLAAPGSATAGDVPVCCVNIDVTLSIAALERLHLLRDTTSAWDVDSIRVDPLTGQMDVRRRLPEVSCTCLQRARASAPA